MDLTFDRGSRQEPKGHALLYFRNNTAVTGRLIEACLEAGIERFVYSSTAAVYGQPENVPSARTPRYRPSTPTGAPSS